MRQILIVLGVGLFLVGLLLIFALQEQNNLDEVVTPEIETSEELLP